MKEQTQQPTIAEMSEVVAKYMGEWNETQKYWFGKNSINLLDWNKIHEVWEKFKTQKILLTKENIIEFKWHRIGIETCIINNLLLEAFTALFHAIEFINNLKQENENNKSI